MKLPLGWLREFVELPPEPGRLAEDLTLAGLAVDSVVSQDAETVLELDITSNRVDCMNVYGVAREVSVLYGVPLRPPELGFSAAGESADARLRVRVEAAELCPRFCARVLDVRLGPSPAWLRERLELVGVRPINNVVDLTNYVMFELGQPSHAFDLARIPEGRLQVRWARDGERLVTLDGIERKLTARTGVVAGPETALALAGIMGGAASEVSEGTQAVVLEAAYWEPLAIRRAAKALAMHTEASHRFERGADPEAAPAATARICHLLERIGAGRARPGLIDTRVEVPASHKLTLRPSRTNALLGAEVAPEDTRRILEGLGFAVEATAERLTATVPTWRGDVSREADLIEEVARHYGLGRIAATLPPGGAAEGLRPWQKRERAVRESLVAAGLVEVIRVSFASGAQGHDSTSPRLRLANPLSEEQGELRSSLVSPGLLGCLRANLNQGRRDVRVFELGRVFLPDGGGSREPRRLALLLSGAAGALHWSERARPADFFDAKGLITALWARLGSGDLEFEASGAPALLHPGRAALVRWRGELLGHVGALHPDVAASWELRDEAVVAELEIDGLLADVPPAVRFRPLERFPAVSRDLSVLCERALPGRQVERIVLAAAGGLLRSVSLADRYEGPPLPEGHVSLTLSLRYQHAERTLTGEEVEASLRRVAEALKAAGAEIRGE